MALELSSAEAGEVLLPGGCTYITTAVDDISPALP